MKFAALKINQPYGRCGFGDSCLLVDSVVFALVGKNGTNAVCLVSLVTRRFPDRRIYWKALTKHKLLRCHRQPVWPNKKPKHRDVDVATGLHCFSISADYLGSGNLCRG